MSVIDTDMNTSIQLREQRAALIAESRKILEKEGTLTPETQEQFDRVMKDVDDLAVQIETLERQEHQAKLEAELKHTAKRTAPHRPAINTADGENRAFNTWVRRACGVNVSQADMHQAESYINPYAKEYSVDLGQTRTGLNEGTGSDGGYLVPTLIPAQVTRWLKYFAPMRDWVRVERTLNGDPINWPTVDFTSQTAAIVSEAGTISETDPTFGHVPLSAYKFAGKILISQELMTDAVIDLVPLIASGLGEVIGRGQEAYFETGSGSGGPTGLVQAALNAGSPVDEVTTVSWNNVFDLYYAIDRVYQRDVDFFCSNLTLKSLVTLTDDNGRYMYLPYFDPISQKWVESFNGRPIHVCNSMNNYTQGGSGSGAAVPFVVAAVPSLFMIRDVRTMSISLNPYLYEATGQIAVFGTLRSDSAYLGPDQSIAYLGCAAD